MAQIKVFGIKERLVPIRERLSEVIHECVIEALQSSTCPNVIALVILIAALTLTAQQPSVAGQWEGFLTTPDGELRVNMTFKEDAANKWSGAMEVPAQGTRAYPITDIKLQSNRMFFTVTSSGITTFASEFIGGGSRMLL